MFTILLTSCFLKICFVHIYNFYFDVGQKFKLAALFFKLM